MCKTNEIINKMNEHLVIKPQWMIKDDNQINQIPNKDKVILLYIISYPIRDSYDRQKAMRLINSLRNYVDNMLDDGTIINLVLYQDGSKLKIDCKQLNTDNISPEALDRLIERANETINKFTTNIKNEK